MDFIDVVRKRRMVRRFTDEAVPVETVKRLIALAQRVPSAGHVQGISFVLVTEEATRRRIAALTHEEAYPHPFVSEAPIHIVVCAGEHAYRERYGEDFEWPVPYWYTDAGAALLMLLLAAVNEDLAAGFVGALPTERQELEDLLGIPQGVVAIGVVLIGHGADDTPLPGLDYRRRTLDEVLHMEHW